jgi:hypothetical protein
LRLNLPVLASRFWRRARSDWARSFFPALTMMHGGGGGGVGVAAVEQGDGGSGSEQGGGGSGTVKMKMGMSDQGVRQGLLLNHTHKIC